jgi:small subunit ribosomal protein S11
MTEEKNTKTDDKKTEETSDEAAVATVNGAELSLSDPEEEKESRRPASGLVELPDSVKEKLEKRKEKGPSRSKKKKGKKKDRTVPTGKAFIKSTYNNTIVTLTDLGGNVISWASAGIAGFKGPKKATPYAAQIITRIACTKAKEDFGLREVSVFVRGVGIGRDAAVRALNANGLLITSIKDITPIPHNGCRPKKPRRV